MPFSAKLKKANVITVQDLANCNATSVSEEVKITLNKVIEHQKKAELLLEMIFDEDILDPLIQQDYTIEQAVEENLDTMIQVTGQEAARITAFLDKVREATVYLDVQTCRTTPISIFPKGKVELEDDEAWAHFLYMILIALIIAFATTLTMTIIYAGILA